MKQKTINDFSELLDKSTHKELLELQELLEHEILMSERAIKEGFE